MTKQAIIYVADAKGNQQEVSRISVRGGSVVASNNHPMARTILSSSIMLWNPPQELTVDDGEAFIESLPSAYSGSRVRVSIEELKETP